MYYNRIVNPIQFWIGDLVLIKTTQSTVEIGAGTLGPNWKGPYRIRKVMGKKHKFFYFLA